ncbi:MAG: UDP-glucose/GDP-mannose dehydrogenase family protein [Candidatus Thermoplasmatota archaeon]|nr:UDP-glucose/GDP-mannose dehydrogenase family protein [Candidatus Thermoplasmatota archaeon]
MKISIIGTGYVGLITGVGLADHGHQVTCVDIDEKKVEMINDAQPPIYEEDLERYLERNVSASRLSATTDTEKAVKETDITFISVGTPSKKDGSIDTSAVRSAAEDISRALDKKNGYHVVCVKSTVTPGTTDDKVLSVLEKDSREVGEDFGLGMNPEFLREGAALDDFLDPDRIVIGGWDERSKETIKKVYADFEAPKLLTDIRTAEMIKYASNSLLATKISFANEISRLCEGLGIDVYDVMDGVGLDHRIKRDFLNAGCGFGGSCFPKDVKAIKKLAEEKGVNTKILEAVLSVNEEQPLHTVDLLKEELGEVEGKRIAILGLTFKGGTDDVRETRALPMVKRLLEDGAEVIGYDPKGNRNFSELIDGVEYFNSSEEALKGADACIIQNDWDELKNLKSEDFKDMDKRIIIDGRRVLDPKDLDEDITYRGIGMS